MKIIRYMVAEIWSTANRSFCHFEPFCPFIPLTTWKIKTLKKGNKNLEISFFYKCTVNENHRIYGSWDMKRGRLNFFVILGHFFPFYPTNSKNQNLEKMKKTRGGIVSLHKCTKNHDHMIAILFLRYDKWRV